ncbi:succinate--CoA ligase subunit alpha [Saccharolobus solfataricus]|uniref:Succinate--CoA ligase [ADP-forming] subunit alpha n=3 Tax=Saccharolobus solfataricus TaxID=2287 RepID=A0A0E3GUE2_SACSO|nr:succinate--CoA ligase subunit alpha [Saccharolobus solfataricus]AKA72717.2 succinate--CoA ligase subunit alpha [Saccharolobus solfataricus]AKA75416.2 succinate--CoA ligase subunit alpha [Saccharolobus solfataricus]AKA78108.2 succinate--CoA ligase subunit alpha [Saccharolobus solfataricus]AZF67230.1 succinate--CoA ligase subunit alpha [Saccharolobus solfataricus]AZF69850.1 succinate--CoA ligase subunit alpha [Saccharolobus solfataricus]
MNKNTRVIVQGITGREGSFHTQQMLKYGTKIVAGVTPGKGGTQVNSVPVYDTVKDAMKEHEADASIIFVPAKYAVDAIYEAVDAGIKLIVTITEHIPVLDMAKAIKYARARGSRIIGPNCPGIIAPEESLVGILPARAFKKGKIGIVSRSGTLTYEVSELLKNHGMGQSTVIGIGGDPIIGTSILEVTKMFDQDPETEKIVVIGEIGGTMEERLAEAYKRREIKKPVIAYIAGMTAPREKRMGHAGAVVYMGMGTFESKIKAFKEAGIPVANTPYDIPKLLLS